MSLKEFIERYDREDSVILLEGKRKVSAADKKKLTALGKLLATSTSKMLFRSGNAEGSDYYFSKGVASVDPTRLQVVIPYSGHRQKFNLATETIALDKVELNFDSEVIIASKVNKKNQNLIDRYLSGERDRNSIKAAYIIRDTVKALGTDTVSPATVALFYDDLENPKEGGTGHTILICEENNIPHINQKVWMGWLEG